MKIEIPKEVKNIDDFLEWFVKNPSCEYVEVEIESKFDKVDGHYHDVWEIIIPKEEPKQETLEEEFDEQIKQLRERGITITYVNGQETLEEVAERISKNHSVYETGQDDFHQGFILGAKWQAERMYREKEVPNKLDSVLDKITHQNDLGLSQWYEVVYYDIDNGKWCSYSGSKTFEDGERVVEWKYCKEIF
jgi:Asp-tRNA(Asn)/Glu-tRNA(Gln) amidotransferase A subunit family amidase